MQARSIRPQTSEGGIILFGWMKTAQRCVNVGMPERHSFGDFDKGEEQRPLLSDSSVNPRQFLLLQVLLLVRHSHDDEGEADDRKS